MMKRFETTLFRELMVLGLAIGLAAPAFAGPMATPSATPSPTNGHTPTATPTTTPSVTPSATPSATPTAGPTPTPGDDACKCEVRNIFPGGTVANISLSKSFMNKAVGAEFAAVDNQGSNSCPDENSGFPPGTLTAQADVNFLVEDESGNVILDRDTTITCINGVDNPKKIIVTFGPENCGPGGNKAGVFDIVTMVTGDAGTNQRTQRIRCRE